MSLFNRHDNVGATESGIHIEEVHGDVPEFKRIYTIKLDNRASMKIVIKMFLNNMMKSGELTQLNGRWIHFDPEAVADKIIDPVLVPLIQTYCNEILAADKTFRESKPSEYIDAHGTQWKRVN